MLEEMSERAHGRGRAPAIAIAAAALALASSVIAIGVVATRGGAPGRPRTIEASVPASVLATMQLRVEPAPGDVAGVQVKDDTLRRALALEPGDVITRVAGHAVRRPADVARAIANDHAAVVYVEVDRDGARAIARYEVEGDVRAWRADGVLPTAPARDPLLDTIRAVDDHRFALPRATFDRVLVDPDAYLAGARVLPTFRDGNPEGLKVFAIRPGSALAAIGLENGDTVRAVNGHAVTAVRDVVVLAAQLRTADEIAIDLTRRGRYELITLVIR